MRRVQLQSATDWPGFARAAAALIAAGVPAEDVTWQTGGETADLFLQLEAANLPAAAPPHWPAEFIALARSALLHADSGRFARLHRLAARLAADRRAWADTLDADRCAVEALRAQVSRAIHKMKAFVRFTRVDDEDGERFVAWFEPEHHIVAAAAPFFQKRFASMRWAILTPRGSVEWDRQRLRFGPAVTTRVEMAADEGEALWLAYYRSIFNPARLKLAMMRREMPVQYWKNLPEARLIAPLAAGAGARTARMVNEAETRLRRRSRVLTGGCASDTTRPAGDALQTLAARARHCELCPFASAATQMVWGEGPVQASLMLVGEQPGDQEDLMGRPFVGPAGQLLRHTLQELGWPEGRLYLTNAVKHFKYEWRGKRRLHKSAGQREAEQCRDWLEGEIAAVAPRALVALGATAARSLLSRDVGIEATAGSWLTRDDGRAVLIVHHPAALLRAPEGQRAARIDQWRQHLGAASRYLQSA